MSLQTAQKIIPLSEVAVERSATQPSATSFAGHKSDLTNLDPFDAFSRRFVGHSARFPMGQFRTYEQQNTQEGDPPRFWAQNPHHENTKKKKMK